LSRVPAPAVPRAKTAPATKDKAPSCRLIELMRSSPPEILADLTASSATGFVAAAPRKIQPPQRVERHL
jgi:hypothetical protein